jgi:hypothetical protein
MKAKRIVWIFTALACAFAGYMLVDTWLHAESAPQQGAGAALAVAIAVIPYCFARALEGADR